MKTFVKVLTLALVLTLLAGTSLADSATLTPFDPLPALSSQGYAISVSPDGRTMLVTGTSLQGIALVRDGSVIPITVKAGEKHQTQLERYLSASYPSMIGNVAWSPDGKWLSLVNYQNLARTQGAQLPLINAETGEMTAVTDFAETFSFKESSADNPFGIPVLATFSADGQYLYYATYVRDESGKMYQLRRYDLKTGNTEGCFRGEDSEGGFYYPGLFEARDGSILAAMNQRSYNVPWGINRYQKASGFLMNLWINRMIPFEELARIIPTALYYSSASNLAVVQIGMSAQSGESALKIFDVDAPEGLNESLYLTVDGEPRLETIADGELYGLFERNVHRAEGEPALFTAFSLLGISPDGEYALLRYSAKELALMSLRTKQLTPLGELGDQPIYSLLSWLADGTLLFQQLDRTTVFYRLTVSEAAPVQATVEQPAAAQTAADDAWICPACGEERTTNFCPADGTARPQAWTCPDCGFENEASYKFCVNCGHKK
ncbi:MAG: PD40 domain-containing protein [Clostridia bacterium]|nr:PD40 domain-containing protein [Clostridia bacterium]